MTSDNCSTGGCGTVKFLLLAFVALSIGVAAYKIAAAPGAGGQPTQAAAVVAVNPPASMVKIPAEAKTAVVYYFYTNTRCYSCKKIEAYTKEAVQRNFPSGYNGWNVVFKSINVEQAPDAHFWQDYALNTKTVVVQKFSGGKAQKWEKMEKVWELLGDKEGFLNYIAGETRRLLDEK